MRWSRRVAFAALTLSAARFRCQAVASGVRAEPSATQTVSRFEAGVQFSDIGFSVCPYTNGYCPPTPPHLAFGPGLTVNLNNNFAIDANLTQTTGYQTTGNSYSDGSVAGGRGLELLVGPRAEVRGGKLGIFVDARVGFLNWSRVVKAVEFSGTTTSTNGAATTVDESFVLGGGDYFAGEADVGVDYAVTPRAHLRVELGDQLVDYGRAQYAGATSSLPQPTAWDSNAMLKVGVYVGVGHAMGQPVGRFEQVPSHRFFDKANGAVILASVLGQATDAVTTQHFFRNGTQEANALARPFVDQGWPGQIGLGMLVNAAQLGVMYGLHKMGHHRLERGLPVAVAAASAYAGYVNSKYW